LRAEFGLISSPPLTNWAVHDAEDDAALAAAGLSRGSKAFTIIAVVVLVVTGYALLLAGIL
jgi:predicted cobalt transporter CbtA